VIEFTDCSDAGDTHICIHHVHHLPCCNSLSESSSTVTKVDHLADTTSTILPDRPLNPTQSSVVSWSLIPSCPKSSTISMRQAVSYSLLPRTHAAASVTTTSKAEPSPRNSMSPSISCSSGSPRRPSIHASPASLTTPSLLLDPGTMDLIPTPSSPLTTSKRGGHGL
jgi:hypothetical protein